MEETYIIVSILVCFVIWLITRAIASQAYSEGHKAGYLKGTRDALTTSRNAFPHK